MIINRLQNGIFDMFDFFIDILLLSKYYTNFKFGRNHEIDWTARPFYRTSKERLTHTMAEVPQNLTKLYYSIGEVADLFDLSNSLLRYWEGEFTELKPRKNRKGDRQFTVKDIEQIAIIHSLVKERGFTIDGARKEMKLMKDRQKAIRPIVKKLNKIKQELEKLKDQL